MATAKQLYRDYVIQTLNADGTVTSRTEKKIAPAGITVQGLENLAEGQVLRLEVFGGDAGRLSTECGQSVVTPPAPGGPAWDAAYTLKPMTAGAYYSAPLPASAIVNLGGRTVLDFIKIGGTLPYLEVLIGQIPSEVYGRVPAGASAGSLIIRARLSDGTVVDKEFTLPVAAATAFYASAAFFPSDNRIKIRVGGDTTNAPTVRIVTAPAGWTDFNTYLMSREQEDGTPATDGRPTFYSYPGYLGAPNGRYVFETTRDGQVRYAEATKSGTLTTVPLTLSETPPVAGDSLGDPTYDSARLASSRQLTSRIVASGLVEATAPYKQGTTPGSYSDMALSGTEYVRTDNTTLDYDSTYGQNFRLKGKSLTKTLSVVTPTSRVTEIAATVTNLNYGQASSPGDTTFNCFLLYSVVGNPVVWIETITNGNSSFAQGTAIAPGGSGPGGPFPSAWARFGFIGGVNTINNTIPVRIKARLGSQTGTVLAEYNFGTGFTPFSPATIYPAAGAATDGNITETITY